MYHMSAEGIDERMIKIDIIIMMSTLALLAGHHWK